MWKTAGYLVLFTVSSAVIYTWGMLKSRNEQRQLTAMLTRKCQRIIRKKLKKEQSVTVDQAAEAIKYVTVSLFYSRKRFGVTDAPLFARHLLDQMENEGKICFVDPQKMICTGKPC
ncbi:MAG: hypothetical protein PUB00_00305 [Clostridiales bacterium]|nr:hypothetical protein [Clostridiales bacterium]